MKTTLAVLSILICLSVGACAAPAKTANALPGDADYAVDAEQVDWSKFQTSADALNKKLDRDAQASLCARTQPDAQPGDVVISYHRTANGRCAGTLAAAK